MEEKETVNVALACVDGEHKGKILIQQRAVTKVNPRTGEERLQSYPYVWQMTFGGKVKNGETLEQAIERECAEELGEKFAKQFDFSSLRLFYTVEIAFKGQKSSNYDYFGTLTTKQYDSIILHSAAERIVWIKKSYLWLIEPLDKSDLRKNFQNPQITSVMFADFVEALQKLYSSPHYAMLLV